MKKILLLFSMIIAVSGYGFTQFVQPKYGQKEKDALLLVIDKVDTLVIADKNLEFEDVANVLVKFQDRNLSEKGMFLLGHLVDYYVVRSNDKYYEIEKILDKEYGVTFNWLTQYAELQINYCSGRLKDIKKCDLNTKLFDSDACVELGGKIVPHDCDTFKGTMTGCNSIIDPILTCKF